MTKLENQSWDWCYQHPYEKRREASIYADVMIVSCSSDHFWYRYIVGTIIPHALLRFVYRHKRTGDQWTWHDPATYDYGRCWSRPTDEVPKLQSVDVLRLTRTKQIIGMPIAPEDIIIL